MAQLITLDNIDASTLTTITGPKILSVVITDSTYTTIDDTAIALTGGYIKIIGSGFDSGAQLIVGASPATTVTVVNGTELRCQLPAMVAGTYVMQVLNPNGSSAFKFSGITYSAVPTWVTDSAITGSSGSAISTQLSATGATSYVLANNSTLPSGLTLSSSGLLSGTVTVPSDTTFNFTVNAIDAEKQDSPKTFSLSLTTFNGVTARYMRIVETSYSYGHTVWNLAIKGKLAGSSTESFLFNDATIRANTIGKLGDNSAPDWGYGYFQLTSSTSYYSGYFKNTAGMVTGDYLYYISEASTNQTFIFDFGSAISISEVWISGDGDNGYDYWTGGYVQFSNDNSNWTTQYALSGLNAYADIPKVSI